MPISDSVFKSIVRGAGVFVLVLVLGIFGTLIFQSWSSISHFGFGFVTGSSWDPMALHFGAKAFLIGTLLTSTLALLISLPFSFSLAILLGEYLRRGWLFLFLSSVINILAGIPSVIYGFWGLFVLVPWVQKFEIFAHIPPYGVGIFTASLILSVMIIPYAVAIGRDVISMVPTDLKEGAFSLGATRMEVVRHVILPYSTSGLFAGFLLSFGRAIGETMAVTMVIGNSNLIPSGFFSPGNTMASVIANELSEATHALHTSSLIELGLYLFVLTALINFIGKWVINRFAGDMR